MRHIEIVPHGFQVRLDDCPPGLFIYHGKHLGMMTEYHTDAGLPVAYIVASGESYCGLATDVVQPCVIEESESEE